MIQGPLMTSLSDSAAGIHLFRVQLPVLSLAEERPNLFGQTVVEVSKRVNHCRESGKDFTRSLLVDQQAHFAVKDS